MYPFSDHPNQKLYLDLHLLHSRLYLGGDKYAARICRRPHVNRYFSFAEARVQLLPEFLENYKL